VPSDPQILSHEELTLARQTQAVGPFFVKNEAESPPLPPERSAGFPADRPIADGQLPCQS
jgi:hypothetical protein